MTKGEQARLTAWRLRVLQAGRRRSTATPGCVIGRGHLGVRAERQPPTSSANLYLRQQYHFGPGRHASASDCAEQMTHL